MLTIDSVDQLEAIYGTPSEAATVKVTNVVNPAYAQYILASPFLTIATAGPEGLDCSPRGDRPGFVRVADEKTLHIPDRRGNNRVDTLRNIVRDPRIGLLFLIPGSGNTLRVNATAKLTIEPEILASFCVDGKSPRSVIVTSVSEVYFQCARAILRSELWNPEQHISPKILPTPGEILSSLTNNQVGGETYDREWPEKARKTLW